MTTRVPITSAGVIRLQQELERLERDVRPKITIAIAEARAHGDLKENGEYHAAREQQGLVEARIRDLKAKLADAHVIEVNKIPQTGTVVFGVTVLLVNVETDETLRYQIVGDFDADIKLGRISILSPFARSIIGKKEGDEVEIKTPKGFNYFVIEKIEYIE